MSEKKVSTFKIILAAVLDFFTVFIIGGYLIARFTGDTTESGFSLSGMPAIILFGGIVLYFVLCSRTRGGTIWQRILGAKR